MRKDGFTLVELIITMVLVGIVAFLGVDLLGKVMEGYVDTRVETLLFNEAQYGADRIAIEIRNAIPNTLLVLNNGVKSASGEGNGVEFAGFSTAGYYYPLQNSDNITCSDLNVDGGDYLSIYNTKPSYFFEQQRVYKVNNIYHKDNDTICILNKHILRDSPHNRVYNIGNVMLFYFKDGKIYRKQMDIDSIDYDFKDGEVMMNYVKNVKFKYTHGYTYREAVLEMDFVMSKGSVSLDYTKVVHIRNVP